MRGEREALARGNTHRGGGGRRCIRPPGAAGAVAMERRVHGDGAQSSWLAFAPLVRSARGWRVEAVVVVRFVGAVG